MSLPFPCPYLHVRHLGPVHKFLLISSRPSTPTPFHNPKVTFLKQNTHNLLYTKYDSVSFHNPRVKGEESPSWQIWSKKERRKRIWGLGKVTKDFVPKKNGPNLRLTTVSVEDFDTVRPGVLLVWGTGRRQIVYGMTPHPSLRTSRWGNVFSDLSLSFITTRVPKTETSLCCVDNGRKGLK